MRTTMIESRVLTEQATVVRRGTMTPSEMPAWFSAAFGGVAEFLQTRHAMPVGAPFARYHCLADGRFEVEAGFPVAGPVRPDATNQASSLPGGTVAATMHLGPYDEMAATYDAIAEWLRLRGAEASGDPWEVYYTPPTGDPSTWRTEVLQPYEQIH